MAGRRFSLALVLRSLSGRRTQSLLVAISIALAVSVVATLLCLSVDVQRKITEQLAEFGANVALVPAGDAATFPAAAGERLAGELPAGSVVTPLLYARAEIEGTARGTMPMILAGVDPASVSEVVRYRLRGQPLPHEGPPSGSPPALVGSRLAKQEGLSPTPSTVSLRVGERRVAVRIVGVMTTGEGEDDQLFMPLGAVEALSAIVGRRSALLVRVPGRPEEVARAAAALRPRAAAAGIEVKLLRRVAAAGAAALAKVRGLLNPERE